MYSLLPFLNLGSKQTGIIGCPLNIVPLILGLTSPLVLLYPAAICRLNTDFCAVSLPTSFALTLGAWTPLSYLLYCCAESSLGGFFHGYAWFVIFNYLYFVHSMLEVSLETSFLLSSCSQRLVDEWCQLDGALLHCWIIIALDGAAASLPTYEFYWRLPARFRNGPSSLLWMISCHHYYCIPNIHAFL